MKWIVTVLTLAVVLVAPRPAFADTPDELVNCPYYTATSTAIGGGLYGGPYRTVPASSACEDMNLRMTYVDAPWVRARAEYPGSAMRWVTVCRGCTAVIAANVPNGVAARVVFDRYVEVFGMYD